MTNYGKFAGWNLQNSGQCEFVSKPRILEEIDLKRRGIVRGGGQSYGDAAVNFTGLVYKSELIDSESIPLEDHGAYVIVHAEHTIRNLCRYLVKTGRFMEVVPGSIDATIGGCVAADIHGKNDHTYGSFSYSVLAVEVLSANGVNWIHRDKSLDFKYVISGYGLTGIIQRVKLSVRTVSSPKLKSEVLLVNSLDDLFLKMKETENKYEYSVGWLDYSQPGLARGFVEGANWAENVELEATERKKRSYELPNLKFNLITPLTIRIYNSITYKRALKKAKEEEQLVSYEEYLFPTLKMKNWNALFGNSGFHEIQVIVKYEFQKNVVRDIEQIAIRYPIFLAGIKKVSHQGLGLLSFTQPGWSIALNIPAKYITVSEVQEILAQFAISYGSPQYLAKDSALNQEIFNLTYPKADEFRDYRIKSGCIDFFESELSKRLSL